MDALFQLARASADALGVPLGELRWNDVPEGDVVDTAAFCLGLWLAPHTKEQSDADRLTGRTGAKW